jgi:hypothetical protein
MKKLFSKKTDTIVIPPLKVFVKKYVLDITFHNDKELSFSKITDVVPKYFEEFNEWFTSRKSEYYSFPYQGGCYSFQKKNILWINLHYEMVEQETV